MNLNIEIEAEKKAFHKTRSMFCINAELSPRNLDRNVATNRRSVFWNAVVHVRVFQRYHSPNVIDIQYCPVRTSGEYPGIHYVSVKGIHHLERELYKVRITEF